jgi:hypothetical protein
MSPRPMQQVAQLGFNALLANADAANAAHAMARECAHLPGNLIDAVPFYRALIDRHHAVMLAADLRQIIALREEARRLASKLNRFEPGIIADPDAPGCVLDRETRAPSGSVPLWGQSGSFEITYRRMRVGVRMDGIFGIGALAAPWLGFGVHAVEWDQPFLSETGFRSFLGLYRALRAGVTPDAFALDVVTSHVERDLHGRLVAIAPRHRPSASEAAP